MCLIQRTFISETAVSIKDLEMWKLTTLWNYNFTQNSVYYFVQNILYTVLVEFKSGSCFQEHRAVLFIRRKYLALHCYVRYLGHWSNKIIETRNNNNKKFALPSNLMKSKTKLHGASLRFPVLCVVCVYLLWALIGSLGYQCLCDWSLTVITLILV